MQSGQYQMKLTFIFALLLFKSLWVAVLYFENNATQKMAYIVYVNIWVFEKDN